MSLGGTPPSTLMDVVRYVKALLTQAGMIRIVPSDPTTGIELIIGERYERQEGAPPRLLFVPDPAEKMGGVLDIGGREIASRIQSCMLYVWGAETIADTDRYDDADAKLDLAIAAVQIAGAGRIANGDVQRMKDTGIVTFGEELRWRFSYARQVPRNELLESAAASLALLSKSPDDPDRPNGGNGLTPTIDVLTTNARP